MLKKFDLFVIGGGSGGVRAARYAASLGIKTGLAEGWDLGGTCVNRGCIPKKIYSYASIFNEEIEIMRSYGWRIDKKKFDWKTLVRNKNKELKRLNLIYFNLLKKSKVEIFNHNAEFIDEKTLLVGEFIIKAKKILIAVGTKPKKLGICSQKSLITSDDAFNITKLPKNILILGGGYIAVEFASIFNGLGVNTTICIRGQRILKDFDSEISFYLMREMEKKGIKFITGDFPIKIEYTKNNYSVIFKREKINFNFVMEATGRIPNLEKLNIFNTSINLNKNGSIIVNEYFETSAKNIFAIGDIIDRVQLTPVAIAEAMSFVDNLKLKKRKKFNYNNIPTAVFSNPSYSCVGYTENEAKSIFKKISIFKSEFKPLKLAISNVQDKVFLKLIINASNNKIIGLHYIGENAAEIVQGFSVAIVNGLTKAQLDKTIGIHPTSAEEIVTLK